MSIESSYLELFRSGELHNRVSSALSQLVDCRMCPRDCGVNREENKTAACKVGRYARVASYFPHMGEEDCLRGWRGSGTIFFSWCNLRCVFCQNSDISQTDAGIEASPERLASAMLGLQNQVCHNINFVTPEHVVPQMLEGLLIAVEHGLTLPIVYNTSAYDSVDTLRLLDGIVDIYMPDFKFWDADLSLKYLKAKDYPEVAKNALKEMYRQVGDLQMDADGLATQGVLVRHLVMPGFVDDSKTVMDFLANDVSANTYVNVMKQYYPSGKVSTTKYPELNRRLYDDEYQSVLAYAKEVGLRIDKRRSLW